MPKYLWRPYTSAVKLVEYYEQTISELRQLSGYDVEKIIELFAAGYTMQPPKPPMSLSSLIEDYHSEHPFEYDENGQMRIVEMGL